MFSTYQGLPLEADQTDYLRQQVFSVFGPKTTFSWVS